MPLERGDGFIVRLGSFAGGGALSTHVQESLPGNSRRLYRHRGTSWDFLKRLVDVHGRLRHVRRRPLAVA
jgi:hypothetical protein